MKVNPKAKKIIENNPVALATITGNKPYIIGIAYCKLLNNDTVLITNNFMRSTVKNIVKNNNVAMVVWNKKWEGYQFLGKAEYYKKGKWLEYVKKMKENKGMSAKGAILVKIGKVIKSK